MPTLTCSYCGKPYHEQAHRVHRSRFCSKICMSRGRRKDQRHVVMGTEIAMIPVLHGDYTVIDVDDIDLAERSWYLQKGYALSRFPSGIRQIHRVILERVLERPMRPDEFTDHINGDRLDNRRSNLRLASRLQNNTNTNKRRGTRYPYRGIAKIPRGNWHTQIRYDGQHFTAGTYTTAEEAGWMRDQWAIALHGDYARLNFEYF